MAERVGFAWRPLRGLRADQERSLSGAAPGPQCEAHRSAGHPAAVLAIVLAGTQDGGGVTYPAIVAGQNIKESIVVAALTGGVCGTHADIITNADLRRFLRAALAGSER